MPSLMRKLGLGRNVLFWLDVWVGRPQVEEFLDLFRCARNQSAKVKDYMDGNGNQITWAPIFRRSLQELEERHLFSLLDALEQIPIPEEGRDSKV